MYVYCKGKRFSVIKASVEFELDIVSNFSITIPLEETSNDIDFLLEEIEFYYKDSLIVSGLVVSRPKINFNDDIFLLELKCDNELSQLSKIRAKSNSHFQNRTLGFCLLELISTVNNWVLSFVDINASDYFVTKDLRDKTTLFSQIKTIIDGIPNLHFKYGGLDSNNNHILEVGKFSKEIGILQTISKINLNSKGSIVYKRIESFGGFSSETRVTLSDALLDPRTILDENYADFPIVNDGIYYYVENSNLDKGYDITKKFNLEKTKNDNIPTQAEIAEAGYSLYLKTVSFLKRQDDTKNYDVEFYCPYDNLPSLGDKYFIHHYVTKEVSTLYNTKSIKLYEIEESLKLTKFSINFENDYGKELLIKADFTTGEYSELNDDELELYDELDVFEERTTNLNLSLFEIVNVKHSGFDSSDCSGNGIIAGKLFTFNFNKPLIANNINYTITNKIPSDIKFNIIQQPSLPSTPLIICVSPSNGDWNTLPNLSEIEIEVLYLYN